MSIKDLITRELEYLSESDLQEFYLLLKKRSLRKHDQENKSDELGELLEQCKISTGISDLAEQHDHYLYGLPKREK